MHDGIFILVASHGDKLEPGCYSVELLAIVSLYVKSLKAVAVFRKLLLNALPGKSKPSRSLPLDL